MKQINISPKQYRALRDCIYDAAGNYREGITVNGQYNFPDYVVHFDDATEFTAFEQLAKEVK